jgi:hypothetical protein
MSKTAYKTSVHVTRKSTGTSVSIIGSVNTGGGGGVVTIHNSLSGLQGGASGEYYHLTLAEHTELTQWLDNVILDSAGDVNLSGSIAVTTLASITHATNPYLRLIKTNTTARSYDVQIINDDFYITDVTSGINSLWIEGGTGNISIGTNTSYGNYKLRIEGSVQTKFGMYIGAMVTSEGFPVYNGNWYSDNGWGIGADTNDDDDTVRIGRASAGEWTVDQAVNLRIGGTYNGGAIVLSGNAEIGGEITVDSIESLSVAFTSGFAGEGFKLVQTNGSSALADISSMEVDNLVVRGTLSVYELEINKISSINGGLIISVANARSIAATTVGADDYLFFDEDGGNKQSPFVVNDYIRAQVWTGRGVNAYIGLVTDIHHDNTYGSAYIICTRVSGDLWNGMDLAQVGNSATAGRQNLIYLTASDTNNPYIDMFSGVDDGDLSDHQKLRIGNLTGITDAVYGALSGYGLWADNVYLSGWIKATGGFIGGFTLDSTEGLYSGSGNTRIQMKQGVGFWCGATVIGDAEFSVTNAGTLVAIGNCTIGSSTGTVSIGASGDAGVIDVWSDIKYYGAIRHWGYSVQNDIELHDIEYSLYYLDAADVAKTLWLPATSEMDGMADPDLTIILVNPTKANFTIDGNGEDIYLSASVPVSSFVLGPGESCTLHYLASPYPAWYELS